MEQNVECNFPPTEINHDLNPPVKINLTAKNQHFKNLYSTSIGLCSGKQPAHYHNDSDMFEYVFQQPLESLKSVTNIDDNMQLIDGVVCKIKGINKPYDNTLFNLFKDDNDRLFDDIFFVIDTGDNLRDTLVGLTPPKNINIHHIHSNATLADSAPKTRPDSKKYSKNNANVKLYSWYYNNNLTTSNQDKILISSFNVENIKKPQSWDIEQKWTTTFIQDVSQYKNRVDNAKKENNKNVIKAYLETYVIPNTSSEFSIKSKIHSSYFIQRKRSGDYFQIWFAFNLPNLISSSWRFNLAKRSPNAKDDVADATAAAAAFNVPGDIFQVYGKIKYNPIEFKKRLFFVTGDWPAVCWAVLNKINTIMVFKHPSITEKSCIYKFSF